MKEIIIKKTIDALSILPLDKAEEIAEFAEFVLRKYEDQVLQKGMEKLQSKSDSFSFLNEEEELYTIADIKQDL